jgi:hypothetical protein
MFKLRRSFVFPRLVSLGDVKFKSWSQQDSTTLYKLDWESFDQEIYRRHQEWNRQCWPAKELSITQQFDEPYETLLKNFRYTIPVHYLEEIRRSTQKALMEWNQERHFDTNIRDLCLGPAIAHIKVAFELLCDCLYDEETNYFLRSPQKHTAFVPLHLIRFWQHQTGSGLILDHSAFHKVEGILNFRESSMPEKADDSETSDLRKFVAFAKDHSKKLTEENIQTQIDQAPIEVNTGPSLGEAQSSN